MENYFKKIKMEDVNEIIKKNGFYYIPTEVLYTWSNVNKVDNKKRRTK